MAKKNAPKFDFGEPSDTLKKALKLLKQGRKGSSKASPQLLAWAESELLKEELRRIRIIAERYQIAPFYQPGIGLSVTPTLNAQSIMLLRKLATDFIPGFSPLTGKGNPRDAVSEHGELVSFIEAEMQRKGFRLSQAISSAIKKGAPWHGETRKKIERDYHRGKERIEENMKAFEALAAQMLEDEKKAAEQGLNAMGQPRGLLG